MAATLEYDAVGEGVTADDKTLAYDCEGKEEVEEGKEEGREEWNGKMEKEEEEEEEDPLDSVEWEGGGGEGGTGAGGAGQAGEEGGEGKEYQAVFEVLRVLGEGTYGTVRAARHRNLGVEVLHSFENAYAVFAGPCLRSCLVCCCLLGRSGAVFLDGLP
jgi:hypothetical protein